MKVAYLLNKSIISGPNIVALSNAESLLSLGVDITVIFYMETKILKIAILFKKINCIYLNASKKHTKKVNDVINKNRIDIVHSHGFSQIFITPFQKLKLSSRLSIIFHMKIIYYAMVVSKAQFLTNYIK